MIGQPPRLGRLSPFGPTLAVSCDPNDRTESTNLVARSVDCEVWQPLARPSRAITLDHDRFRCYLAAMPPRKTLHRPGWEDEMRPVIKEAYLKYLASTGTGCKAAAEAGVAVQTIYNWRAKDHEFDEACNQANRDYCNVLRAEIHRRGVIGYEEPVFYQGVQVGNVRKFSDRMLELQAKAKMHEYRDRQQIDMNVSGGVVAVPGIAKDSRVWEEEQPNVSIGAGNSPN